MNWVCIALQGVIFLEKKIINAMSLTAAYDAFRILTNPMNNYSHELDLGVKSIDECRESAIKAHAHHAVKSESGLFPGDSQNDIHKSTDPRGNVQEKDFDPRGIVQFAN